MPELAQQRIQFIDQLHEVFLRKKGYGALAYITLPDILNLFEQFLLPENLSNFAQLINC